MRRLKKVLRLNYSGTSLIELCCVIALIGVIATAGLIGFKRYPATLVRMELNRLTAVCIYMRRKALIEGHVQRLMFGKDMRSYSVDTVIRLVPPVIFGTLPQVKGSPGDPRKELKEPITYTHKSIEAYPDGTLSAGTVYLSDESHACLYALTTDASAVTAMRIYRYGSAEGRWELI